MEVGIAGYLDTTRNISFMARFVEEASRVNSFWGTFCSVQAAFATRPCSINLRLSLMHMLTPKVTTEEANISVQKARSTL